MTNLASVVSKRNVTNALKKAIEESLKLRKGSKFALRYKQRLFPPKEIIRLAALDKGIKKDSTQYSLAGGPTTNNYLEKMGFEIIQISDWKTNSNIREERIARLTFNKNAWAYPSGSDGKSKTNSYESENGYGHEEWIFDFSKLIDGYKYGFLEPINKNIKKYEGKTFNIYLFTIDSRTKEKIWVGKVNNIKAIGKKESEKIKATYIKQGWYKEMKEDLKKLKLKSDNLDKWDSSSLFNVCFKPADFEKYPDRTLIPKDDKSISAYYYVLLHVKTQPTIVKDADGKFELGRCNPNSRYKGNSITKKFEEKLIKYPFLHHQISRALEKTLLKNFDKVYAENQTGYKTVIDIVAEKGKKIFFFEIKTYNDVRTCIRQALGQLLEYSYFPDKQNADEIFIVTPHEIFDKDLKNYIRNLRETVGLPIKYIYYDLKNKRIGQTI